MFETVQSMFDEIWRDDLGTEPPRLTNDTLLSDTGFDSLAFAVFFIRLDELVGIDPFAEIEAAAYPRTIGDLIAHYEASAKLAQLCN